MKRLFSVVFVFIFSINLLMISLAMEYMGGWTTDEIGTWYKYNDGTYPSSCFIRKDGDLFFLGKNGYKAINTLVFGRYQTDSDGKIPEYNTNNNIYKEIYSTNGWKQDVNGWWYQYPDGSYAKNVLIEVDGKSYWLGADGYLLRNCYARDGAYYGDDGAWVNKTDKIPKYKVYMNPNTNPNTKYIVMEYKNNSDNDIVIYSEFAKLYDREYDLLNRDLQLVEAGSTSVINLNSVTISPGERKMLSFSVKGNSTYYDKKTIISFILTTNGRAYHCMSSADGNSEMVRSETFDDINN